MSTVEEIQRLRKELAEAERKLEQEKKLNQKEVLAQLEECAKEMNRQYAQAEALASSVGLIFYFSSGYETFEIADSENWSESSKHC